MGVINHVLVKHCVRIAEDESGLVLIGSTIVIVVRLVTGYSEEHSVDLSTGILFVSDPTMLPFKILSQDHAHLLSLSKKRCKLQAAGLSFAKTLARFS